jgi:hypothetical protein
MHAHGLDPRGGKCGVADDDDAATRQPAVDLQSSLTGPVQQGLGGAWRVGIEAFGRRKHGEKGQAHVRRPMECGPAVERIASAGHWF